MVNDILQGAPGMITAEDFAVVVVAYGVRIVRWRATGIGIETFTGAGADRRAARFIRRARRMLNYSKVRAGKTAGGKVVLLCQPICPGVTTIPLQNASPR